MVQTRLQNEGTGAALGSETKSGLIRRSECPCMCHSNPNMIHVVACCDGSDLIDSNIEWHRNTAKGAQLSEHPSADGDLS